MPLSAATNVFRDGYRDGIVDKQPRSYGGAPPFVSPIQASFWALVGPDQRVYGCDALRYLPLLRIARIPGQEGVVPDIPHIIHTNS